MLYIGTMKQIFSTGLVLAMLGFPAHAQDTDNQMGEGFDLLQEGTRLMLEGLMKELGPALLDLEGKIVDLSLYELPEVLPNGDIIIRRRLPVDPPQDGETDI